jgi:CHAD domain-containing protein
VSYRLEGERPLAEELRAIVDEQLADALGQLRSGLGEDRVKAVHETRKDLKKTRAVVRLVRSALPADERTEDRVALRDAGRRISPYRDRDVALETIDGLAERHPDAVDAATWELVRDALRRAAERAVAAPLEPEAQALVEELEAVRARLGERLGGGAVRWKDVRKGLKRTYARGRRSRRAAERGDDPQVRHDWRKRVKDRWYHERLLRDTWPEVVGAQVDALDELGDVLGTEHDLVLIEGRLRAMEDEHEAALAPLVELVGAERAALWARARALGERLYAEKPGAYARRMSVYAARWRAESPSRRS